MSSLSVRELSSLLMIRHSYRSEQSVQQAWEPSSKAMLVILWGLLIYPQLDPSRPREKREAIDIDEIYQLFHDYIGSQQEWQTMLDQLSEYDYIRFVSDQKVVAGTKLWTSIDAAKMYQPFRASQLARTLKL
ncbi:hypothetical protein [Mechercharimyces sp. CAU 1602]|uniref:hypothetical protein n=1 Tax=Mechercharimyces sp. CAU 1602 TaxID=2973933 RepID=UPI00216120D7|nr:hypothetical protein [Mechercharimyces sp. CAU 1602]MCS1350190.1 hypothetical protein [Mechercharimyces sp. CAU 1602]